MEGLRVGRISSINYEMGTARVLYMDKDEAVTKELPLLSFEYCMPSLEDMVLVCHLPNGATAGVILGRFWSVKNLPPESGQGLYRKDMSREAGKAMIRYQEDDGELKFKGPQIKLNAEKLGCIASQVKIQGSESISINGTTISISGGTVQISGVGDVILDGISLKSHTHTCSTVGTQSSKAN